VLLSQDEARFQMVPTLAATLGVKGHRPVVGTRDCKDVLYVFCVMNLISGAGAGPLVLLHGFPETWFAWRQCGHLPTRSGRRS